MEFNPFTKTHYAKFTAKMCAYKKQDICAIIIQLQLKENKAVCI